MSDAVPPSAPNVNLEAPERARQRPKFPAWALMPIGLLVGLMTIQLVMLMISTNDPGFAVEPDYYQKAVNWDAQRAQQQRSAALGWQANLSVSRPDELGRARLSVSMNDQHGAPLSGARVLVSAFHNARAARVQELQLSQGPDGSYSAALQLHRAGIWEFRLRALRDGHTFSMTDQLELHASKDSAPEKDSVPKDNQ